ncbi:hypothetical protein C8J55DRAFT_588494 [Lentinula edodes]|uniref:Uncharacterized protein n=1 Tax=Lentinula lateritia TaxID=40482 RepID=A0A9W9DY88_9AGAR|nr:hypothetical protein C8J55DRAFT_588494 [Lentinula edodes]
MSPLCLLYIWVSASEYEKSSYYNGITGDADHPNLVYRSDFLTTPFPEPVGRHASLLIKSLRGVFDTPLNGVWDSVGPQIIDLLNARKIDWTSVDPARFFTHAPLGEDPKGSLRPVVIWVGVIPDSTSADTAHEVSQQILTLLQKNGVNNAVVEWREAVSQMLAGMEEGTLTLWFHEIKDNDGNPSNKVYGVSNCHILRKNTASDYEYTDGAPMDYVRVCGMRRFQRGLDEITKAISNHKFSADIWTLDIAKLQAKEKKDAANAREIKARQHVTKYWSDLKLYRNIGHVQYAEAISVDVEGGTRYTSDWAAFVADEAKGSKMSLRATSLISSLWPYTHVQSSRWWLDHIQVPYDRKLRIEGCATKKDLSHPAEFDSEGQHCLMVGKNGNTTDLTIGRYAGLVSFTRNQAGIESIELGIYNSGDRFAEPFSAKGDSGSLVWHSTNDKARIVGQIHSGQNKGGSTSNHVTYCTPGWYLLSQIQKRFQYADFYRTTWSA